MAFKKPKNLLMHMTEIKVGKLRIMYFTLLMLNLQAKSLKQKSPRSYIHLASRQLFVHRRATAKIP